MFFLLSLFTLLFTVVTPLAGADVSVIVPCCAKHFSLLPALLDTLADQTMLPKEVVVSLSSSEKISEKKREALLAKEYPFSLKLLCSKEVKFAGMNRNIAAKASSGEVIVTQDADDLPHRQRIEIICYLLKKYGVLHLIHQWTPPPETMGKISSSLRDDLPEWQEFYDDFDGLEVVHIERSEELHQQAFVHNGNIALMRSVAEKNKWPLDKKGQDVKFNDAVINRWHKSLFVKAPLVIYRNNLSSHNKRGSAVRRER